MVRDHEVEQLVDDHVLADVASQLQQFSVKVQVAVRRAGGPLVLHGPQSQPSYFDIQLISPMFHPVLKLGPVFPASHHQIPSALLSKIKSSSTIAVTLLRSSSWEKIANVTFFLSSLSSFSLCFQPECSTKAALIFLLISSALLKPASSIVR